MRALILAIAAALIATSAAAQTESLARFNSYRFGMSVAEARAAGPTLVAFPFDEGEFALLHSSSPTFFGRMPLLAILAFRNDRLIAVGYSSGGPVDDAEQCTEVLSEVVSALEPALGVATGGAGPGELGQRLPSLHTRLGSELRHYSNVDGSQRRGLATWRSDGLWGEASSHYTVGIVAPDARMCSVEVMFRADAPRIYPPLTPPTAAALESARLINVPRWDEQPDPEVWDIALPDWRQQRNVDVNVDLDCLVIADGRLNCMVARESPEGHWFGEAALYVSRGYRMAALINGEATEGRRVRVPIQTQIFAQGDLPPPNAPSTPAIPIEELQALAARAPSQAEREAAQIMTGMVWVERPDAEDFGSHYPQAAVEQNLNGRAVLECLIEADGSLRCAILSEEPEGMGFGLAALGLSRSFRAAPEVNGVPTAGRRTRIPITFRTT